MDKLLIMLIAYGMFSYLLGLIIGKSLAKHKNKNEKRN